MTNLPQQPRAVPRSPKGDVPRAGKIKEDKILFTRSRKKNINPRLSLPAGRQARSKKSAAFKK